MPQTPTSDEANIRICCRIRKSDLDYLKQLAKTNSELGYNMLIREIVADYVKRLRDLERQNNDRQGTPQIEITEDDLVGLDLEPEPVEDLKLEL